MRWYPYPGHPAISKEVLHVTASNKSVITWESIETKRRGAAA
jgi:hypothetical protein